MKILGIIPARGGSKGVPEKNIRLLKGKPLITYTIESGLYAGQLNKVMVTTDNPAIMHISRLAGAEVPFQRPSHLAQDDTPTLPVIQHALQFYLEKGEVYDAICLLQPTTPFRKPGFIDEAILQFSSSGADSLLSVVPVPSEYNPHWVFEPDETGFLRIATGEEAIIARRQALPKAFIRDGAVYLTKASVILHENSLYGKKITWLENSTQYYINIDTQQDWEAAEQKVVELGLLSCVE